MRPLETWLLNYLINSVWQIPLLYAAAWLVVRSVRRNGPALQHRIWVSTLILELLLPACTLSPPQLVGALWQFIPWHAAAAPSTVSIPVTTGPAYAHGLLHLPAQLFAVIALAYIASMTYFTARLLWSLWKTGALRKQSQPIILTGAAANIWSHCCNLFNVHNAHVAESSTTPYPMTIGIRHRLILLPTGLLETLHTDDLAAALAHEFAHMQRRDFAKNLLYALLPVPIAYHPLLWLTRTRIEESREMVCDALAAEALTGSHSYAHALLRLATRFTHIAPDHTLHAIGIFDANIFERRVMNLTHKPTQLRGIHRLVTAAACIAIGLGTCASSLALRMNVAAPISTLGNRANDQTTTASAPSEPTLISGKQADFPADMRAKKGKFNGTVIVALIVGTNGLPTSVVIAKSLRADFDQSAVDAVKQYRFKPALLNGNPVEYPLTIYINFQRS